MAGVTRSGDAYLAMSMKGRRDWMRELGSSDIVVVSSRDNLILLEDYLADAGKFNQVELRVPGFPANPPAATAPPAPTKIENDGDLVETGHALKELEGTW